MMNQKRKKKVNTYRKSEKNPVGANLKFGNIKVQFQSPQKTLFWIFSINERLVVLMHLILSWMK